MQFQVPQFIETEDKIVGPFSLRQFLYVGASGLASFFLYMMIDTFPWLLLSVFIVGAGLSFAFVKVNGRPLTSLFLSAFSFYWKPQTYVWQSEKSRAPQEQEVASPGLKSVLSGILLKNAMRNLQTGTKTGTKESIKQEQKKEDLYQIFQKVTGDRQASRRVDYR